MLVTLKTQQEKRLIIFKGETMDNHEEEIGSLIEATEVFKYQRPAITIIERNGNLEVTMEFLTLADYKGWKELQH